MISMKSMKSIGSGIGKSRKVWKVLGLEKENLEKYEKYRV
jgi:hypothetical protein